jgi:hypothetical protein
MARGLEFGTQEPENPAASTMPMHGQPSSTAKINGRFVFHERGPGFVTFTSGAQRI